MRKVKILFVLSFLYASLGNFIYGGSQAIEKSNKDLIEEDNSLQECTFLLTSPMKVCYPKTLKKNFIEKISTESKKAIEIRETIDRPKFVKEQDSIVHVKENIELTQTYNKILQAVFSDIEHFKKVSTEVAREYETPTQIININSESDFEVGGKNIDTSHFPVPMAGLFMPKMIQGIWEAEQLNQDYRTNIISVTRKVYLTSPVKDRGPESKFGDVYIDERFYEKYKNDPDFLATVLVHEAFHVLGMPEVEKMQVITSVLPSAFSSLSYNKNGTKPHEKCMHNLKECMFERFSSGDSNHDEIEIDRLALLHFRNNKNMREKYLAVLSAGLESASPERISSANLLDKYIDDEPNTDVLEHNLINIKAGLMNSMNAVIQNPPTAMPPGYEVFLRKLQNKGGSSKEKDDTKLQLENMLENAYMPKYKLRSHAVNGDVDHYKEYMEIIITNMRKGGDK